MFNGQTAGMVKGMFTKMCPYTINYSIFKLVLMSLNEICVLSQNGGRGWLSLICSIIKIIFTIKVSVTLKYVNIPLSIIGGDGVAFK